LKRAPHNKRKGDTLSFAKLRPSYLIGYPNSGVIFFGKSADSAERIAGPLFSVINTFPHCSPVNGTPSALFIIATYALGAVAGFTVHIQFASSTVINISGAL
jgi:hypothetical protein